MTQLDPNRFHGDQDARHADIDFAVNVRATRPPIWLEEALVRAIPALAEYPAKESYDRVCERLVESFATPNLTGRNFMLLNGAAEGFALLPRLRPEKVALIHPGFTEPDAVFEAAEVSTVKVVLPPPFTLDPTAVPEDADMVVVGNPTNPTGVVHPAGELLKLTKPGRYVVIDEAFLDVSGDEESLIGLVQDVPGLIVLRSLTKTFSIAGLRCGILAASETTIAFLELQRSHWPMGTLQLAGFNAVLDHERQFVESEIREIEQQRNEMLHLLDEAGLHAVSDSKAPYVLVKVDVEKPEAVRLELLRQGIAVRRCDTFPGLDFGYWRLAVRPKEDVLKLVAAFGAATHDADVETGE